MRKNIRIVALASFIEGLITIAWLASIPASGGTFSPFRLASMLGILLVSLGCLTVFIYARSENRLTKNIEGLANSDAGVFISFLLIGLSLAAWVAILYKSWWLSIVDEAIYTRFLPIAVFGFLFCLQIGILFLLPHVSQGSRTKELSPVWTPFLILLGCFLFVCGFMSITHIGFVFDDVGLSWGPPGTPITFAQVSLVFTIGLLLAFAYSIIRSRFRFHRLPIRDIVIFVALWGLAVILWWNEPVSDTHFNPPLAAPNYEYYPNSDALIFDKASYHLIFGTGFSNQLIRRPLYAGMLALFHKLGGFGYEDTIFFQILILALIPPLIYLLASKLSNRLAGLIAGGLILLREKNAIELSNRIVASNAKLMMSDLAATLGIIAFVYVMVKILSRKDRDIWLLGIAGACLGLTALVRAQALILLVPALLFLVMEKRSLKFRLKESIVLVLGLVLVMSPWIWRNWNLTGTFVLDDRGEEKLLARNYSSNPIAFPELLPGETEKDYSARIKREVFAYIIEHPADVAFFVSNHFFRNLATGTVYMAPLLSNVSPREFVDQTHFWDEWKGTVNGSSGIAIFVTLILLSLGITVAQQKNKLAGWFPFMAFLFYSVGNALVRSSGWRFALPIDWVIPVYYSIGLAYLPSRIKLAFDGNASPQSDPGVDSVAKKSFIGLTVFFILFLVGASVPIAERLIPARDFSDLAENTKESLSSGDLISLSEIETFLEQDNAVFYSGIALYPRYIGDKSRIYLAYAPKDFTFLHFWLINAGDNQIVFPTEKSPDVFPHASKVSVLGCKRDHYIMAWAVILHSSPDQVFIQNDLMGSICPSNAQN